MGLVRIASRAQKSHAWYRRGYWYRPGSAIRMRADSYGPNAKSNGCEPTLGTVAMTVSDAISITVTVVSLALDTYTFVWSGLTCDMKGPCPTGIIALTVCVAVLMTET